MNTKNGKKISYTENTHENTTDKYSSLSWDKYVWGKVKGCDTHPRVSEDNGDPVVTQGSRGHIGESLSQLLWSFLFIYLFILIIYLFIYSYLFIYLFI